MNKTKIEWCDYTWNPVTGCWHGCSYCYAEKIANRFGAHLEDSNPHYRYKNESRGWHSEELHTADAPHFSPGGNITFPYDFEPTLYGYRLGEPAKMSTPRNIFVCSMADLFGDWIPDGWITAVFRACEEAPQHRYFFLTKNPVRYAQLMWLNKLPCRDNMWYGTSVTAAKEMPDAFRCIDGSYNAFVSMEPMLKHPSVNYYDYWGIKWFIMGAETGNRKGKVIPDREWACTAAVLAKDHAAKVFMKESLLGIVGEENMLREFPWQ